MTTPEHPDDGAPVLRRAEAEAARRLEEACDDQPAAIAQQSTDELLRLEEELLAAARAVGQAARLRRELGDGTRGEKQEGSAQPGSAAGGTRVREFRTASGDDWRVWEVRPGAGGRPRKPELYPADYVRGWLAFELLNGDRRKRLPRFTADWATASDAELERLLEQAVDVPKRRPVADERGGG